VTEQAAQLSLQPAAIGIRVVGGGWCEVRIVGNRRERVELIDAVFGPGEEVGRLAMKVRSDRIRAERAPGREARITRGSVTTPRSRIPPEPSAVGFSYRFAPPMGSECAPPSRLLAPDSHPSNRKLVDPPF
jgi:hypothetical protein